MSTKTKNGKTTLEGLRKAGFDESRYDRREGYWRVRCSQCEAIVINGHPCHEAGCPNAPRFEETENHEE